MVRASTTAGQRQRQTETDRQTDRQTDRKTGRQADRQTDRQGQTAQTDRHKQTDRQTDRQSDRQKGWREEREGGRESACEEEECVLTCAWACVGRCVRQAVPALGLLALARHQARLGWGPVSSRLRARRTPHATAAHPLVKAVGGRQRPAGRAICGHWAGGRSVSGSNPAFPMAQRRHCCRGPSCCRAMRRGPTRMGHTTQAHTDPGQSVNNQCCHCQSVNNQCSLIVNQSIISAH